MLDIGWWLTGRRHVTIFWFLSRTFTSYRVHLTARSFVTLLLLK